MEALEAYEKRWNDDAKFRRWNVHATFHFDLAEYYSHEKARRWRREHMPVVMFNEYPGIRCDGCRLNYARYVDACMCKEGGCLNLKNLKP